MTVVELEARLLAEGCNPAYFSIGLENVKSGTDCLAYVKGRWRVFYSERGQSSKPVLTSKFEAKACQFYYEKISAMEHWHLVGFFEDGDRAFELQADLKEHGIDTIRNDMPPLRAGRPPVKRVFVVGMDVFVVRELYDELPQRGED